MSLDEGTTDQNTDRKILYTIHYDATKSSLPKVHKTLRLGDTELSIKGLHRNLHVKLVVGGVSKGCDSRGKKPTDFIVGRGSEVRIELYAEHTLGPPVCIASKTRWLASLIDPGNPVQLDIVDPCLTTPPILSLRAQVTIFNPGIGKNVDEIARSLALAEKWLALGDYARRVVDIGSIVAEVHPVAKAIFSVLELGVEELETRKEYHDNLLSLVADMTNSCEMVLESDTQQCAERREHQVNTCNALVPEIFRVLSFIRALVSKSTVFRLRSKINEEVENLRKGLNEIADAVKGARHIDTQNAVFRVEDIVTRIDINNTLSHLQIAKGVEAASIKACLPDTRVMLLETIMDWVFDPDGFRCFCLYGTAGQGKTAVAHSVARRLAGMGIAAPFFAFDRNNRKRVASQLFPSIARSLAYVIQHQLEQLRKLRADQLETTDIPDQCERLLLSCLRDYSALTPIIIIVDALDECPNNSVDDQKDREAVLKALKTCIAVDDLHHNIRFFVTARLDPDIQAILSGDATLTQLYSIDDAAETRADIRRFVALELLDARTAGYVDTVTDAAQTHFECAAVLCRELKNGGKPMSSEARNKLIERIKSQPGRSLYETYQLILETHLDKTDAGCLSVYRQLLSWILTVRQPQPRSVFAEIAKLVLRNEDTMGVLEGLGSLLTGTVANAQDPIRPLHTSFRDYVLDAEASGVFCITSEFNAADSQLALACFGIMSRPTSGLRYNLFSLPSPFVYKKDIDNLDDCLSKDISPGLRYACREISAHLSCSRPQKTTLGLISAFKGFLRDHFLLWLEACGWLGYEPCDSLYSMLRWAKTNNQDDLASILADFIAFEKRFHEAISTSPPQVYITGLLFAPTHSHVSRLYRHHITGPIEISGYEQEREWPPGETLVTRSGRLVFSVAYSPIGTRIVAGLSDATLRMWDAGTGRQVGGAMRGHTDCVFSVAFSHNGSRIASGSRDNTIRLWDAKTGQQQGEALHGHTDWVWSVAFSPDGATVVSGSDDSTLRLWNAQTGKEMGDALEGHTHWVRTVVFSHDGTRIISGAEDRTVRIWDTATHRQLGDPIQHEGMVMSVAISRDGKYFASGSSDGNIRVWDIEGRQQVWALRAHEGLVYAVAFSSDSMRIVSGGDDNTVRICDVASGKQVGDDLRGHTYAVKSVAFSPDGKHVASGSYDTTTRVWDVREVKKEGGRPVGHTGAIFSVACSSNGKYVVSGSEDRTVRLWDAQTGQPAGDPMTGHDGDVNCVTFSPDSTRVASASNDRTVRVWDVPTRLLVGDKLRGHEDAVLCVAFSPDGTRLVSGSADNTLRLWDPVTWQQFGEPLRGHENSIRAVSFSRDGLCIASGSEDCTIRLWVAQSQLQTLEGHQGYVWSVAFSQDGEFLVSGSNDGRIRIWDTRTGGQMGERLTGHTDRVRSVSFSPDGRYIVSGADDLTVRVWEVQTRQQVGVTLRGNESRVRSVVFSSDGTRIVSGSDDGTIRVWDFANLLSSENSVDDAIASPTIAHVQASLGEDEDCWLVYNNNGTERPILWIPHHLRHIHRVHSPFHVQFVPPTTPQMHITLNDSFHLDKWPVYTPAPVAAKVSKEALEPEE